MKRKSVQLGIAQIGLIVGIIIILSLGGIYLINNKPSTQFSTEAASNNSYFTNLTAELRLDKATFNFNFSGDRVDQYIVEVSTTGKFLRNEWYSNDYAYLGTSEGTVPIVIDNPVSVWNKYTCGLKVYWRIHPAVYNKVNKTGEIRVSLKESSVQEAIVDCSSPTI